MRNPELESLRHFVVDFSIVLATPAMALVPSALERPFKAQIQASNSCLMDATDRYVPQGP